MFTVSEAYICIYFVDLLDNVFATLFSYFKRLLRQAGVQDWKTIGASPTYNPLGDLISFLSVEDIITAVDSFSEP